LMKFAIGRSTPLKRQRKRVPRKSVNATARRRVGQAGQCCSYKSELDFQSWQTWLVLMCPILKRRVGECLCNRQRETNGGPCCRSVEPALTPLCVPLKRTFERVRHNPGGEQAGLRLTQTACALHPRPVGRSPRTMAKTLSGSVAGNRRQDA